MTGFPAYPGLVDLTSELPADLITKQVVDYVSSSHPFVAVHFILECGAKLEAEAITISTAASLFHKFCAATSLSDYDPYLLAATSLYLAGKVEDNHLKLRDVINIVQSVLHRSLEPLPLGDHYWNILIDFVSQEP